MTKETQRNRTTSIKNLLWVVSIVLTVIVTLSAEDLYHNTKDWIWPSLEARITFGEFYVPTFFGEQISQWLQKDRQNGINTPQEFTEFHTDRENVTDFLSLRGYWSVLLQNGSKGTIENVEVHFPSAFSYSVIREGTKPLGSNGTLAIVGKMKPLEQIRVVSWTKSVPDQLYAEKIKVIHKDGVASVKIYTEMSPSWQILRTIVIGLLIAAPLVLLEIVLYHVFCWYQSRCLQKRSVEKDL